MRIVQTAHFSSLAAALTAVGLPLIVHAHESKRMRDEAATTEAQPKPVVEVGPTGLSIAAPNDVYVVKLRGTLHFDGRFFLDDATPESEDTFLLRRVRPTFEGTLHDIYDFHFTPDFGDGRTIIVDAFATARFRPWLHATAGKFKVPVGLERLQSSNDLRFIERGFPTSLVPNRDLGVSIEGSMATGVLTYSIGYFNGVVDGGSSDGNDTPDLNNDAHGDWAARLFAQPFSDSRSAALRRLGIGIAATYGVNTGNTKATLLPHYRTPGQQTFFRYRSTADAEADAFATFANGERLRIAPQLSYYFGGFGVLAEYVKVAQEVSRQTPTGALRSDRLVHDAWQLQLSWFVTGERESFGGVTPRRALSPDEGTWGAFELAVRIHELDIDDDAFAGGTDSFADPAAAVSKARAYGIGLTWYFNQNLKLQLNYDVTQFEGGAPSSDREDERALFTRFAVGF